MQKHMIVNDHDRVMDAYFLSTLREVTKWLT
jgi:hypothetical protein